MAALKSTEIAAALAKAMAERTLVQLTTRYDEIDIRGYVMGVGPGFVMIAVVNDRIWFDGFECFRRSDIMAVEDDPCTEFVERALELRGEIAPSAPPVSLASIEALLATAGQAYRLVTVHREGIDPEICHIGSIQEIDGADLILHEVTPAAEWEDEFDRYLITEITRVAFGADYEDALSIVAGEPPKS
jgi:hypothetical protein